MAMHFKIEKGARFESILNRLFGPAHGYFLKMTVEAFNHSPYKCLHFLTGYTIVGLRIEKDFPMQPVTMIKSSL